jgi:PAS domain S-box-containing protein
LRPTRKVTNAPRPAQPRPNRIAGMRVDLPELLRLALPQLQDHAVILADPEGTIVAWLGGAQEIFGYTEAEMIGQPLASLFVPEDAARAIPEFERAVARHRSSAHDERWHLRKDGSRIWASGTTTALRDASGLRGFLKLVRDRTDLRIASEARANHLAAVEATLASTQAFLRTLGHEIRNPLGAIRNVSHILERSTADARNARLAQIVANQVAVLERLATDLMDVSRIEQQKVDLHRTEVDLCALLRDEVAARQYQASEQGIRLEAILPAYPVMLRADADRLRQAVGNLIGNAIKYTPAGGCVWAKTVDEADDAVIRIQDTGIGIAADVLPRIFDLFTQEQRARQVAPGGLGIGLAIVREIVELHGGLVQARSGGEGKGSEFTIRLPRRSSEAQVL